MSRFSNQEYATRLENAQAEMAISGIDALLLTQEVDFAYFAGFHTRFWQSPTRPWFLILPAGGGAIAVIPSIGAHLLSQGPVRDIRTWAAPDLDDDGLSLLSRALGETGAKRIGIPSGMESYLRMPLADFARLKSMLPAAEFTDDANIARRLREIKSDAEIKRIAASCAVASRAFARVGEIATIGKPLSEIFRAFQILCLEEGADFVPYLAGALGAGGYDDVISPADETKANAGDVLMLDTGLIRDGYFCDFDRNFSFGKPENTIKDAHKRLIEASDAAIDAIRPGALICDIYTAMDRVISRPPFHNPGGRFGHGLGLYLTEWPSIIPSETSPLAENMVMTIEPSIGMPNGKILVHEENIVVTNTGARRLTPRYEEMIIL